jgi:hypothetical protein
LVVTRNVYRTESQFFLNLVMEVMDVELWSIIRDLFYSWQCGKANTEEVCRHLCDQGLFVSQHFREMLERNSQTRGLSFGVFIRTLERNHVGDLSVTEPGMSINLSPRCMHISTLGEVPLSASIKAPFGTDDNICIRGLHVRGDEDPACLSVIHNSSGLRAWSRDSIRTSRKSFSESANEGIDETVFERKRDIPLHLRGSINPITGEEPASARSLVIQPRRMTVRRLQENSSNLGLVESGLTPTHADLAPEVLRRGPNPGCLASGSEVPIPIIPLPDSNHNIFHTDGVHPEPYRPMSRMFFSKTLRGCPFATDKDDLVALRTELHSRPLGRNTIPHVASTF